MNPPLEKQIVKTQPVSGVFVNFKIMEDEKEKTVKIPFEQLSAEEQKKELRSRLTSFTKKVALGMCELHRTTVKIVQGYQLKVQEQNNAIEEEQALRKELVQVSSENVKNRDEIIRRPSDELTYLKSRNLIERILNRSFSASN